MTLRTYPYSSFSSLFRGQDRHFGHQRPPQGGGGGGNKDNEKSREEISSQLKKNRRIYF